MRLIISSIQNDNENTVIYGITEIGIIKGIWKYEESPVLLNAYSVELSFEKFDKQIVTEHQEEIYAEIWGIDDTVHFHGVCEDIDEDVYYIRFADDWLDMVEIPGDTPEINKGDHVYFSAKYRNVHIYPYSGY